MLGAFGVRDPRVLALVALAAVALLVARVGPPDTALGRMAACVVLPPAIIGVVFGSGDLLMVALVVGAAPAVARQARVAGGVAVGTAVALFPRLLPAVPFLASGLFAIAAASAALVILAAAGRVAGGTLAVPSLGPGLGLSNLRLYAGAIPGSPDIVGPALVAVVALVALVLARRAALDPPRLLVSAAGALMTALWLAPSASADDVVAPIALLAIAVTQSRRDTFDTAGGAL